MTIDPRFGSFLKTHREFFDALGDAGWETVAGYKGIETKVLSGEFDHDTLSGSVTKLSRWAAGTVVSDPQVHDWCEEVFFLSGSLSIGTLEDEEQFLPAGTYAVRPPNIPHGPFFSRDGCVMLEFLYYPPK